MTNLGDNPTKPKNHSHRLTLAASALLAAALLVILLIALRSESDYRIEKEEPTAFQVTEQTPTSEVTLAEKNEDPQELQDIDQESGGEESISLSSDEGKALIDASLSDTKRHRVAEKMRKTENPELLPALISVLNNPQEEERFRSWAVQHLYSLYSVTSTQNKNIITDALMAGLDDRHIAVRREALFSLHRLNNPAAVQPAETALSDPDMADIAIRIMRRSNQRQHLPIIREIAATGSVENQIAAIVTLAEWGDVESRPLLEEKSKLPANNETFRLQRAATIALATSSPTY